VGDHGIHSVLCFVARPGWVFSDRFGRRTGVLLGIAIFEVASLLCGLAGTATGLTAARILQGVGAASVDAKTASMLNINPTTAVRLYVTYFNVAGSGGVLDVCNLEIS
jgi:MFS family permease